MITPVHPDSPFPATADGLRAVPSFKNIDTRYSSADAGVRFVTIRPYGDGWAVFLQMKVLSTQLCCYRNDRAVWSALMEAIAFAKRFGIPLVLNQLRDVLSAIRYTCDVADPLEAAQTLLVSNEFRLLASEGDGPTAASAREDASGR